MPNYFFFKCICVRISPFSTTPIDFVFYILIVYTRQENFVTIIMVKNSNISCLRKIKGTSNKEKKKQHEATISNH
jgi:hypothetical protein